MAEAWTVSRTTNGINVIDENGLPVCTRVGLDDANLIASAPRLQEQVRIMEDALAMVAAHPLETDEDEEDAEEYARRSGSDAEEMLCICIKTARTAIENAKPEERDGGITTLKGLAKLQEQVKLLREALEKLRDEVRALPCEHYAPQMHDACVLATKTLEATKEGA